MKNQALRTQLLALAVLSLLYLSSANQYLMNYSYDIFINLKNFAARSDDVIIIGIDKDSFEEYAVSSSGVIPRRVYADLIDRIARYRPSVLAFDVIFERRITSSDDAALISSLASYPGNIVMSSTFQGNVGSGEELYLEPWQDLGTTKLTHGYVNIFRGIRSDADPIRRFYLPYTYYQRRRVFSLPLAVAEKLGKIEVDEGSDEFKFYRDNLRSPVKVRMNRGFAYINYVGDLRNFSVIPLSEFMHATSTQQKIYEKLIADKVVLVGAINQHYRDFQDIPAMAFSIFPKRKQEYGVIILANIIDNLLNGNVLQIVGPMREFSAMLLCNAAFAGLTSLLGPLAGLGVLVLSLFLLLFLAFYLFFSAGLLINYFLLASSFIGVYLLAACKTYYQVRQEQEKLRSVLHKYVSPEVARLITRSDYEKTMAGEKRVITIVFADIRGFTQMSERMDPWAMSELLNKYFNRMTEIIFRNGGTIDKFMGDAIMILFGAPLAQKNAAFRAVKTAHEMREELKILRRNWEEAKEQAFHIGIGINTGEVFVGNLGSDNHKEYTALGDAVNTAARLENKALPDQILFSESVWNEVGHLVSCKELAPVLLRGKSKPSRVFELIDPAAG